MKKLIPFILLLLLTGCATSQLHERVALLEYRELVTREEVKDLQESSKIHTKTLMLLIEQIKSKLHTGL